MSLGKGHIPGRDVPLTGIWELRLVGTCYPSRQVMPHDEAGGRKIRMHGGLAAQTRTASVRLRWGHRRCAQYGPARPQPRWLKCPSCMASPAKVCEWSSSTRAGSSTARIPPRPTSCLGPFAEFEPYLMNERERAGIALAKQRGASKGIKGLSSRNGRPSWSSAPHLLQLWIVIGRGPVLVSWPGIHRSS